MNLEEFLQKLRGDDLLRRNIKVERFTTAKNPDGGAKVTIYAERTDEHGTTEKLYYTENPILSCGHAGEVAGVCTCGNGFCKTCASSSQNICVVCHRLMCDDCRAKTLRSSNPGYHKKCRWKFILNSLFER
jgi:hypothetical protein